MKKMTILHYLASPFWGGGEKYVYDLASKMLDDGHCVAVYSFDNEIIKGQFDKLSKYPLFNFILKKKHFLPNLFQLISIVNKQKIDIVHIHNTKTLFVAALAKCLSHKKFKLVMTIHLVKKSKNNLIRKWETSKVDKIIFVSRLAANKYLQNSDIQKDKVEIVWNSVPSDTTVVQNDYTGNEICFVGRLAPEKGVDILIDALSKTKSDCRLNVVGNGDEVYVASLKQKVAELNLSDRVNFVGFTTDIGTFIENSLFGVLPSAAPEAFGLSNIEFMRHGKVQITTNNGAQKEYLEDMNSGVLINPANSDILAEKIDFLVQNPQLCKEMGENAKSFFEKELSYERFYNKILKVYAE